MLPRTRGSVSPFGHCPAALQGPQPSGLVAQQMGLAGCSGQQPGAKGSLEETPKDNKCPRAYTGPLCAVPRHSAKVSAWGAWLLEEVRAHFPPEPGLKEHTCAKPSAS